MKTPFLSLAAALLGLSLTAQANTVETNVSITLKFYFNPTLQPAIKGKSAVIAYKTAAVRNADFIASLNAANAGEPGFPFPKNARLIRQDVFTTSPTDPDTRYLLRDQNGNEADVTANFDVTRLTEVVKSKINTETSTGTISLVTTDSFEYIADPSTGETDQALGAGISRYNIKSVLIKDTGDLVSMLASYRSRLGGNASFVQEDVAGIVEGGIRLSGAKLRAGFIPQPPQD